MERARANKVAKVMYVHPGTKMELVEDKTETISVPRYTYGKEELPYLIDALTEIYDEWRKTHEN